MIISCPQTIMNIAGIFYYRVLTSEVNKVYGYTDFFSVQVDVAGKTNANYERKTRVRLKKVRKFIDII